jgi:mono/diheme cytochrome c family protein
MFSNCLCRFALLALAAFCLAGPPILADAKVRHPVVPGFERFFTVDRADLVKGGQLLLGELNCTSCHKTDDISSLARKPAPILDEVASRVRIGYLKKFLNDPQAVKPGTTMPNLFAGDNEKTEKIEALVHFLASTGSIKMDRPDTKGIGPGRNLYHNVGCVACHGTRDAAGKADKVQPSSVPLGDLQAKYSMSSLAAFLENPLKIRPGGRMPHVVGSSKDARAIASYLLQGTLGNLAQARGATNYAYFEGAYDTVPDFDKLKPVATGSAAAFDLGVAHRGDNYAVKFEGYFRIDRPGTYTFTLTSDDGSTLLVDGKKVVNNDGVHPAQTARGSARLAKGVHKVLVGFFQAAGGAELDVQIGGPGLSKRDLAGLVGTTEAFVEKPIVPVKKDDEDYLEIQPALVEKGKALFASIGCASCHALAIDKKPIVSTPKAVSLEKLKNEGGCLSAAPAKGLPWYALSAKQTAALKAVLKTPSAPSKEPAVLIARTLTTFNCYACHERDKVGGIEEAWNKFFQTNQPEMGEEARIPPPLDGVGAKIKPDYLKHLLDLGAKDRPYMFTRMPGFGQANLGPLAAMLSSTDKLPPAPLVKLTETPAKVKAGARHMVGGLSLGCIKCHTFNGKKAEGVQGIDMTVMTKRLQRDWYFAYLLDPQKLRPGTRMPTAWTNGQTVLPDVLDGTANGQIEAIWVYLQDGPRAQLPIGGGENSIPLVPYKDAIIYRNFIKGSGTRAIAVGYPEKANLAFDANEGRLALLWQGAFMDAARHWTGRGEGEEAPLGDNILSLPNGAAFGVLPRSTAAWPATPPKEQGYRFRGYRLTTDERPTFLYSFGDVKVEDFPNAVAGKEQSIKRTLKLATEKPIENLYFRAAVGTKIEPLDAGWYRIDGWKMKLEGGGPVIRPAGGKSELLVPIRFKDGKAQLVQEFVW